MKNIVCVVDAFAVHLRFFNSVQICCQVCIYSSVHLFTFSVFCMLKSNISLPNIASWCMDVLGKGVFACWSISSSGLVLQHEHSLKNMHLFSLWLQWIIFSSFCNGNTGCAKQHVPGIRERRCFLRTENVLKNASSCWQESRLCIMDWGFSFHGSLQSIGLTSTSSEDVQRW